MCGGVKKILRIYSAGTLAAKSTIKRVKLPLEKICFLSTVDPLEHANCHVIEIIWAIRGKDDLHGDCAIRKRRVVDP